MNGPAVLSRREFLTRTSAAAALASVGPVLAATLDGGLIDTNVYLGRWPFRRLAIEDPSALVDKLRRHGVTQAWVGSFDALLYKDIPGVNARLADSCARDADLLLPFGTVNPTYVGWEGELKRCAKLHRMRGIRLFPNYHGYKLSDSVTERLLRNAADLGLLVQIPIALEDERTIHPLVNVPAVDTTPLTALAERIPALRVQVLNAFRTLRGAPLLGLVARRVHFEIATVEGVEGVANLLAQLPAARLCFGSYSPEFYFEAAKLKLTESILTDSQAALVRFSVARQLLAA